MTYVTKICNLLIIWTKGLLTKYRFLWSREGTRDQKPPQTLLQAISQREFPKNLKDFNLSPILILVEFPFPTQVWFSFTEGWQRKDRQLQTTTRLLPSFFHIHWLGTEFFKHTQYLHIIALHFPREVSK